MGVAWYRRSGHRTIERAQAEVDTATLSRERLRASCQGAQTGVVEAYQVPDVDDTEVAERNYRARLAVNDHDELTYAKEHPAMLSVAEAEVALAGALQEVEGARRSGDRAGEVVMTGAIQFILRRTPAIRKILRSFGL